MTWKWGVFLADLNPVIGSEQKGKRPVLVVSDEDFNSLMPKNKLHGDKQRVSTENTVKTF